MRRTRDLGKVAAGYVPERIGFPARCHICAGDQYLGIVLGDKQLIRDDMVRSRRFQNREIWHCEKKYVQ
jgi:hypothetical protein